MPKPITKIIITLPSKDTLKDIWKVFDYIILKMEELNPRTEMPHVDAQGRKKFRAEVMKATDETVLEVFGEWVTILIPEMVPATSAILKQAAMTVPAAEPATSATMTATVEEDPKAAHKALVAQQRRDRLAKAREIHKQNLAKAKAAKELA